MVAAAATVLPTAPVSQAARFIPMQPAATPFILPSPPHAQAATMSVVPAVMQITVKGQEIRQL
jgi:hypothetical protein